MYNYTTKAIKENPSKVFWAKIWRIWLVFAFQGNKVERTYWLGKQTFFGSLFIYAGFSKNL